MTWCKALGCAGYHQRSRCRVSRQDLDPEMDGVLGRPLDEGPCPRLWLDALITRSLREVGRIRPRREWSWRRLFNGEGMREIIPMDVGTSEDGAFWLACPTLAVRQGPQRG